VDSSFVGSAGFKRVSVAFDFCCFLSVAVGSRLGIGDRRFPRCLALGFRVWIGVRRFPRCLALWVSLDNFPCVFDALKDFAWFLSVSVGFRKARRIAH
jgi:hypothetical protein